MQQMIHNFVKSTDQEINLGSLGKNDRKIIYGIATKLDLIYRSADALDGSGKKQVVVLKSPGYAPGKKIICGAGSTSNPVQDPVTDLFTEPIAEARAEPITKPIIMDPTHGERHIPDSSPGQMTIDMIPNNPLITPDVLQYFYEKESLPVAVTTKEDAKYYLALLDPYFGTREKFINFYQDIEKCRRFTKFTKLIEKFVSDTANEVKNIYSTKSLAPYRSTKTWPVINIYKRENDKKYFVSIDIKAAWFTVFKKKYFPPESMSLTWEQFASRFTSLQFALKSKKLRQMIYGKSGCQPLLSKYYRELLDELIDSIDQEPIHLNNDELLLSVDEKFNITELKNKIDHKFPDQFNVTKFRLIELGNKGFFVKECTTGKIEFKICGAKFIAQCIKYYNNNPITEIDRQFTDIDGIATYKKSIFEE
jgi:hypothetical protein